MKKARYSLYPLQAALPLLGIFFAGFAATIFQSLPLGFATLVLFVVTGITWRRDMPPILPFCLAFQWISAVAGTMFFRLFGYFPGGGGTDNLDLMIWTSSLGFIALGVGARSGFGLFAKGFRRLLSRPAPKFNSKRIFFLILALYIVSLIYEIAPKSIWFGGAQLIYNLLDFRFVFLVILGLTALSDRSARRYLWLAVIVVVFSQLLTGFSRFKEVLFALLLISLFQWRPWENSKFQKALNARVVMLGIPGSLLILATGLVWTGGLKDSWRSVVWSSESSASQTEELGQFSASLADTLENFDATDAADKLVQRLASGSMYFSHVLNRVPEVVAFEDGNLTKRAVVNATVPRFLFPDKPNLGGDSWLVRRYAGLNVSGDESGTSVGLGYMPEFYIDFGFSGIFLMCFGYAFLMIALARILAASSRDKFVFIGMLYCLLSAFFMTFDASFAKLLAGSILRTIVFSALAIIAYPALAHWLAGGRPGNSRSLNRLKRQAHLSN